MGNIAGDKMLAHIGRILNDHRPITADIFLTNYCNNKCPYCTYGRWELDEAAYSMKYEEFVTYAERLIELGVKGFILTGGGEPTICKDFEKIAGWLERKGIHYGVNTNFNEYVKIKPDYLKISLDGWDEESYKKSRGVNAYEKVKKNIRQYAEWKKNNSPHTSLGVQRVVSLYEDVYKFYYANKDLPVDYIVFRPIESTGGIEYIDEYAKSIVIETIKAVECIQRQDDRVKLNFKWELIGQQEEDCTAQWAQIAVDERGQVMYCCHKPYQIIGHVMDEDILEKKDIAVTDMSRCDIPCRMTAPNMFVAQVEKERKDAFFI
jgi:MoaA/NifB/PqqE/SkfB family radical SAM enzyme